MHICTTQSLRAGIDIEPMLCGFCNHKTLFTSWVGAECDTCGADYGYQSLPGIVRSIREHTGLTRRQIADELGYKYETIKTYEFVKCSYVYRDKISKFVTKLYA
jgi:hypothetical protein